MMVKQEWNEEIKEVGGKEEQEVENRRMEVCGVVPDANVSSSW